MKPFPIRNIGIPLILFSALSFCLLVGCSGENNLLTPGTAWPEGSP